MYLWFKKAVLCVAVIHFKHSTHILWTVRFHHPGTGDCKYHGTIRLAITFWLADNDVSMEQEAIPFNPLWSLTYFIVDNYLQIIEWCYNRILLIWHPQDQRGTRLSNIPGFQTVPIWSKFLQVIFCYCCNIWGAKLIREVFYLNISFGC